MARFGVMILAAALLAGLGSASAETRRVDNVSTIQAVDVSGRFRVEIVPGERAEATLSGPAADLDRMGVRLKDGVLKVWEKCSLFCGRSDLDVVVRVTSPSIAVIEASKGAEVKATGLGGDALAVDIAMGASLDASGTCQTLSVDVAMGGALSAKELVCRRASVDASMGGVASIHATESVKSDASMGGVVTVYGHPPSMDSHGTMGGTTSRAD